MLVVREINKYEEHYFSRLLQKEKGGFPQLIKKYGGTPFYNEAFNSFSYLRDFLNKK